MAKRNPTPKEIKKKGYVRGNWTRAQKEARNKNERARSAVKTASLSVEEKVALKKRKRENQQTKRARAKFAAGKGAKVPAAHTDMKETKTKKVAAKAAKASKASKAEKEAAAAAATEATRAAMAKLKPKVTNAEAPKPVPARGFLPVRRNHIVYDTPQPSPLKPNLEGFPSPRRSPRSL
jgi:hypothetical protein